MRKSKILAIDTLSKENRKRVFIENDFKCEWNEDELLEFENDVNMKFNTFFHLFIGEANNKKEIVLDAILNHDDIYVDTSYVGNSGDLFNEMMNACLNLNIKGKRIFNFRPVKYLHMDGIDKDLYSKVAKNNLFYFRHDYSLNKTFILSHRCYK